MAGEKKALGKRLTDEDLRATVEAVARHPGDTAAAAVALGISRNALYSRLARAAARGLDGSTPGRVPLGQVVKGVSTLYDRAGQVAATWVKTREDAVSPEALVEAITDAAEAFRGSAPIVPRPRSEAGAAGRFHLFPWPDFHLGMLADPKETGEAYDLRIAERLVKATFTRLVEAMPPADHAILLGLGDLVHADDDSKRTKRSGNDLDVDGRHQRVQLSAIRLVMWGVGLLLAHFPTVEVRILPGNHDEKTALAVAAALSLIYEENPRVTFDLDPSLWWFLRRGKVMLGATHGHNVKPEKMPGVMAQRRREDFGASAFAYCYHGHFHTRKMVEEMGVPVECLQTIAPPDAWHHGAGYGSGRSLVGISFSETAGEIGRSVVNIKDGAIA